MSHFFAVLLQEHPVLGNLIYPFFIEDKGKDYYMIHDRISGSNLIHFKAELTDEHVKIIDEVEQYSDRNITKRFTNKKINPRDFVKNLDPDYVQKFVRPFIEKQMARCISIMMGENIRLFLRDSQNVVYKNMEIFIEKKPAEIIFNFIKKPNETHYFQTISHQGKIFNLTQADVEILTNDPCWLKLGYNLYHFEQKVDGKKLRIFFNKEFILVPGRLEEKYYSTFVRDCIRDFPVQTEGIQIEYTDPKKFPTLMLEYNFNGLPALFLKFSYDGILISPQRKKHAELRFKFENGMPHFTVIKRDEDWELQQNELLHELGLKRTYENAFLVSSEQEEASGKEQYLLIKWINIHAATLTAKGFIIDQNLSDVKYFTGNVVMEVVVKDKTDWFDIYAVAKFGDDIEIPMMKFKNYLINNIREYQLPDGRVVILPDEWFDKYTDLVSFAKKNKGSVRVNKAYLPLIDKAFDPTIKLTRLSYQSLIEKRMSAKLDLPDGLNAELRSYQFEGFQWLNFMRTHKLGGCLADDMGLGKTLQTLSVLLMHYLENTSEQSGETPEMTNQLDLFSEGGNEVSTISPSIIVMPASLIHNWENEIRKFTPHLKSIIYTGAQRFRLTTAFPNAHIIITTYGTIRNDFEMLEKIPFEYIVLDESQVIKNPTSKVAKAVGRLNGNHRLALSGTPIENSLTDLWSQMNFLNKGLLGDLSFFKRYFAAPIEKNNDEEKQEKLHLLIKPFILRRTKSQVEKELPELSEEFIYCEMPPEQQKVYQQEQTRIRNFILENIEGMGIKKSAFVVLQALTKLRQMANHPSLVDDSYTHGSGKFDEVIRNLEILISEGHKVLVFSSFVKHLNLFSAYFDENGIGYSYLTGETQHRDRVIKEFQTSADHSVFLISVKAGGVGLNLTEADYVFLLDPWWNPAVENQAVNRAHRIGQTKHVFSYRFITLDTIEEKILNLQKKKSRLAELFIKTDNPLKEMSVDSIKDLLGRETL